jgi:iron complex transport system permease protein
MNGDDPVHEYIKARKRAAAMAALFIAALFFLLLFSSALGAMRISAREIIAIIAGKITGNSLLYQHIGTGAVAALWELRLPRIICGILTGAGLSVAGLIFQAILQNPLADPYTLGISTGAAFGASLAILVTMISGIFLPVSFSALLFAGLSLFLVIVIAERGDGIAGSSLVMAGIIVSAVLSAGISFIKMLSGEHVSAIVFWLMGSLSSKSWQDVLLLVLVIPPAIATACDFSGSLNILTLGNRTAESLGVSAKKTSFLYLLLGAIITAVCVSVCGVIGFVGLVVPHLLRFVVPSDNRLLLPLSALLGALLLSAADTCARLISVGEIPVGVLTTLLGGPFFVFIFIKRSRPG